MKTIETVDDLNDALGEQLDRELPLLRGLEDADAEDAYAAKREARWIALVHERALWDREILDAATLAGL